MQIVRLQAVENIVVTTREVRFLERIEGTIESKGAEPINSAVPKGLSAD